MHETRRNDDAKTSQDGCLATSGVGVTGVEKGRAGSGDRTWRRDQQPTLFRWRDEFLQGGVAALNGRGCGAEKQRERKCYETQLAERDRVIGELTVANRILKKGKIRKS